MCDPLAIMGHISERFRDEFMIKRYANQRYFTLQVSVCRGHSLYSLVNMQTHAKMQTVFTILYEYSSAGLTN